MGLGGVVKPDPNSVETLELSVRANNMLRYGGLTTLQQVANVEARIIENLRNVGAVTLQEIGRALLVRHITPGWLKEIARGFGYEELIVLSEEEAEKLENSGWRLLAGGYTRDQYWMLERALADLDRGNIEYKLVAYWEHGPIHIYRKGGVVVEPETED